VAEQESENDPAIRLVTGRKGGLPFARNAGVAAASGDYVLIVDADNVMRPRVAERLLEVLDARPEADFAVPAFRAFDDCSGDTLFFYGPSEIAISTLFITNTVGGACALHRRQPLLEVRGFPTAALA